MSEELFRERYVTQRIVVEHDYVIRSVAVDKILGREVLITQLNGRVGRRAAVQEHFRAAAREVVRLSHANVVALYDIGVINGFPYAVQEYSHSEPLSDIIAHEGPFHAEDVEVLVEQVASALDYAHLRGVAHFALRPDAITVDYDGQLLVTDFGIGRVLDEIAPGNVATLKYRAPEQIAGRPGDHRSDVFSLGVIAYEMLTGRSPFDISSTDTVRESIMTCSPVPVSAANPTTPRYISDAVNRAMSADPNDRFQTAGHFAESFRGHISVHQTADHFPSQAEQRTNETDAEPPKTASGSVSTVKAGRLRNYWPRGTAAAAWIAVALAVLALVWVSANLLNDRDSGSGAGTNNVAGASPTAPVQTITNTQRHPTAIALIGLTLVEANAQTDLAVRVAATEISSTFAAGQIIRQIPKAGNPVRTGEVSVIVSSGAGDEPIQLSSVSTADMTFDQVARQLTGLGLNVSQVQEGSGDVPEGRIIRIEEGSAMPGETVHVVISMGDRVQIPTDIQFQPITQAVQRLEDLGIVVGQPIAVSRQRIVSFEVDLGALEIIDGDVVGIQESNASFGQWVERGATVTPVYFDASLT